MSNILTFSPEQLKLLKKLNEKEKEPSKIERAKKQENDLLDALVSGSSAQTRAERRKLKSNLRRIWRKQKKKDARAD